MPTVQECLAYAEEYKVLATDPNNSARRSAVLGNISRSWTALAKQLETLSVIDKSGDQANSSIGNLFYRV